MEICMGMGVFGVWKGLEGWNWKCYLDYDRWEWEERKYGEKLCADDGYGCY